MAKGWSSPTGVMSWIGGGVLVVAAAALLVWLDAARELEATLAGWAIRVALGTGVEVVEGTTEVVVGLGGQYVFTLDIGMACSVVLLFVPLLLTGAVLLLTGRARVRRVFPAVVLGGVALLLVNQVRVVVIAASTLGQGLDGFGWAHTVYGSAIVLVGLLVILAGFIRFVSHERTPRRADHAVTVSEVDR